MTKGILTGTRYSPSYIIIETKTSKYTQAGNKNNDRSNFDGNKILSFSKNS